MGPRTRTLLATGFIAALTLGALACHGGGGGSTSNDAVQVAPAISAQPQSTTVTLPATASFSVTASGTPRPYQWKLNGTAIPGATSSSYVTAATTLAMNASSYTVTVTNAAGSVTSSAGILTVLSGATGGEALTVPASGSGGFNYTQGSYIEGFSFTANRAIVVTQLGAYDSNLSSLPYGTETFAPAAVGLYDLTTHALLASATVKSTDPVTGVFHYVALATPITLNTTDTYAVVWVSSTNHYIASPTLPASAINPAITYLAFASHGTGGLTTSTVLVEPDWFFTYAANGLNALNYDLGPNFVFTN